MAIDPNVFAQYVTKVAQERNIDITGEEIAELFPNIYDKLDRCRWCGAFVDKFSCYESTGIACIPHNEHHQADFMYEHDFPSVQREAPEVINRIRNCPTTIHYYVDGCYHSLSAEEASQFFRSMGLSTRMIGVRNE